MAASKETSLIVNNGNGLYCPQGDFYIDPLKKVSRALITHAHSDHARSGSKAYLTASEGFHVLRGRLGRKASIETLPYGQKVIIGGVTVSFHSAGHVLGSAQIRLEYQGEIWVVSGDYKTRFDPTCAPFELVKCHCFITESTFGLPIFRWPDPAEVAIDLNTWWEANRRAGIASIAYGYSFGKAQRLLAMADSNIGPIFVHSTVAKMNEEYRRSGVSLPAHQVIDDFTDARAVNGALVVAPPAVNGDEWLKQLGEYSSAFASGWTRVPGSRQRYVDKGLVLSDHADWWELNDVIKNTEAERVLVAHGYVEPLVRHLRNKGADAQPFRKQPPATRSLPEEALQMTLVAEK